MSAFIVKCEKCGGKYMAGMVGMTPWPTHVCPEPLPTIIDPKLPEGVTELRDGFGSILWRFDHRPA